MELEQYLKQRLATSTIKTYLRALDLFFLSLETHKTANYQEVLNYIGSLRKQQKSLNTTLSAIKQYYSFLVFTKQRIDNPAKAIKLKDKRSREIQLQDLFSKEELEVLLDRNERYRLLKNKNRIILSLLIYQGLTTGELVKISLEDLDLEEGLISVKGNRKLNSRVLKLQSKQVFWLLSYLQKDRVKLITIETDILLLTKLGTAEKGEGISYLLETQKYLFPNRNLNPKTVRQSVITNLLKQGKDLRKVQVFAGHKYPSATEKYKQSDVEELKNQVLKYHPLR
jgi:integrase/recombinase XerD